MKKSIVITLLLTIVFLVSMPMQSQAVSLKEVFDNGDKFMEKAGDEDLFDQKSEKEAIDTFYWSLLGIAIAAAVIIGLILSIQYISSGVDGKAAAKGKLIAYAVGVVVSLGAFGIWKLVVDLANQAF